MRKIQSFSQGNPRSGLRGFSLVEMLVVISIVAVMVSLTIPAMSLIGSLGFTNASDHFDQTLKAARSTALAQNTYTWVGFHLPEDGGSSSVVIAAVYSLNGQSTDLASGNVRALLKPFIRTDVKLDLDPASQTGVDNLKEGTLSFTQTVNGVSTTFPHVIQFSPIGEASIKSAGSSKKIRFQLQPMRGTIPNPNNLALIEVSGMSGLTAIVRN